MVADPKGSVSVFLVNVPNESGVRPLEPQVQDAGSNGIGGEFFHSSALASFRFSYSLGRMY